MVPLAISLYWSGSTFFSKELIIFQEKNFLFYRNFLQTLKIFLFLFLISLTNLFFTQWPKNGKQYITSQLSQKLKSAFLFGGRKIIYTSQLDFFSDFRSLCVLSCITAIKSNAHFVCKKKKLQNRDYGKLGDGDLNYGAGLGLYSPYFSVSLYTTYHNKSI